MSRSTILAFLTGLLLALAAGQATAFKCMPIYGNWCGIAYPNAGWPPPVDAFDAACMRHDICTAGPNSDRPCDIAFVAELRSIAAQVGYLPRPLQWAEYVIRLKAGGPWGGMPMPMPGDALGVMSSLASPCW
ncbi:MAG: hypothetical protein WBG92_17900 [Thiohalocapsa sp.]